MRRRRRRGLHGSWRRWRRRWRHARRHGRQHVPARIAHVPDRRVDPRPAGRPPSGAGPARAWRARHHWPSTTSGGRAGRAQRPTPRPRPDGSTWRWPRAGRLVEPSRTISATPGSGRGAALSSLKRSPAARSMSSSSPGGQRLAGCSPTMRASSRPSMPISGAQVDAVGCRPKRGKVSIHASTRVPTVSTSVPSRSKRTARGRRQVRGRRVRRACLRLPGRGRLRAELRWQGRLGR